MSQQQWFVSIGKHLLMPECYVDIKIASKYTSLPVKNLYEWAGEGSLLSSLQWRHQGLKGEEKR